MKIAFQRVRQWDNIPNAESELAQRLMLAANVLGLKAIATSDVKKIGIFKPNVVIPLHFFLPKIFDAFTVGCMWNPTYAIERNQAWDNVKSYDGYAVSSPHQEQVVRSIKFKSPIPYLVTRIYPSTNTTKFNKPVRLKNAVYIGSNWDQGRHGDFFSVAKDIRVYGPKDKWNHLSGNGSVYGGEVPFDGKSVLEAYHNSGIGLALHHSAHNQEGIPSMRPFEIAASGAVMIADHNPFVQQVFGDNALYLDTSLDTKAVLEQLDAHTHWIKSHVSQAQEMAHTCHEIFNRNYSLEVLLKKLLNDIENFNNLKSVEQGQSHKVEIVIRSDGNQQKRLFRALRSVEQQTYPEVAARIIFRGEKETQESLQQNLNLKFPNLDIEFTPINESTDRGTQFFRGLRASTAKYIGFLDHDDVIFQDHVEVLTRVLENDKIAAIAYSGSVKTWEGEGKPPSRQDVRSLAYFHDADSIGTKAFITSNSYLVRRDKVPWHLLHQPIPHMDCREDRLFLKLMWRNGAKFIFSEKVTCAFYWLKSKQGHSGETDDVLSRGKEVSSKVMRQATLPWRAKKQIPTQRYFMTYAALKKCAHAIRNDISLAFDVVKNIKK